MRKKLISLILALISAFGIYAGTTSISVIAKADTELAVDDLFEATNTYNLKENVQKETKSTEAGVSQGQNKYEDPQYSFKFDFSTKNTNTTTIAPYVTVFTHGYNSQASDWSNNAEILNEGDSSNDFIFQYSSVSMLNEVGTNVFNGNTLIIKAEVTTETNRKPYHSLKFSTINENNANEDLVLNEIATKVGSKHLIVIFDGYRTKGSNANIYYQFNYMLSTILYKLKDNYNGKIPKVNLIGHSRGGLTNLQYALDHPDIVENLISIGTPYAGSTSATLVKNQQDFKGDGLNDIINPTVYNCYKDRWNNNYNTLYKNINAVSIGAFE